MTDALGPLPGLDELASAVVPMADRFHRAGFRLFLVGGVVRDLVVAADRDQPLAGGDIDLTTDARPDDIKRLVEPLADVVWTQGERFGTIGARVAGRPVEITTHRAEAYDPESRKPTVSFGDEIEGDLERRDFTINAAAIELPGGQVLDPHRGIEDLRNRLLRTPLSPEISFTDDPLRMLRAARFIPRFDLVAAPELVAAATTLADRLDIVSVERVADELERLLAVERPRAGFDFLIETGLLDHVLPGLVDLDRPDLVTMASLASAPGSALVRRAGLLWPLRRRADEHLRRLRYSRAATTATVGLLGAVDEALSADLEPVLVRRLTARIGAEGLGAVPALTANLHEVGLVAEPDRVTELAALIEAVSQREDLDDLDAPLSGAEVMEILDLTPGPMVGRALAHLKMLRMERGPLNADQARRALENWWAENRP